jgi:hypothetical protein
LHAFWQFGTFDYCPNVRKVAMDMMVPVAVLVLMYMTMVVVVRMPVRVPVVVPVAMLMLVTMRVGVLVTMFMVVPMVRCVVQVAKEPFHVVIVILEFLVHDHVKVAGVERAGKLAGNANLVSLESQALQGGTKPLFVRAKVEQRAHHHIAANAAFAFQLKHSCHRALPFLKTSLHDR